MASDLYDIKGFPELERKLKQLPDKVKKRELIKILGQEANPTVKAARNLAPIDKGLKSGDKIYKRKKRQVRNVLVQEEYTTGFAKKSIGKKTMTRARNPMIVVKARDIAIGGKKKYGGWYVRQMLIRGTKYIKSNPFMDRAYDQTKGLVTAGAKVKIERYIAKQIARLSK